MSERIGDHDDPQTASSEGGSHNTFEVEVMEVAQGWSVAVIRPKRGYKIKGSKYEVCDVPSETASLSMTSSYHVVTGEKGLGRHRSCIL